MSYAPESPVVTSQSTTNTTPRSSAAHAGSTDGSTLRSGVSGRTSHAVPSPMIAAPASSATTDRV